MNSYIDNRYSFKEIKSIPLLEINYYTQFLIPDFMSPETISDVHIWASPSALLQNKVSVENKGKEKHSQTFLCHFQTEEQIIKKTNATSSAPKHCSHPFTNKHTLMYSHMHTQPQLAL